MKKIRGRKPTRDERKVLEKNKLDTYVWLIQSNNPSYLQVVNRDTGEVKQLAKVV